MYEGYKNFGSSEFYRWWGGDVSCREPVCVWNEVICIDSLCLQAILTTQQRIQQLVPGFRFNLGFSGKYFHHGTSEENLGDDMLLGKCPVCAVILTVVLWYCIFRPIRRIFFPEKCDLNSTCVLCAEGKYCFQTYKYLYIYYTTSSSWDSEICFQIMRYGITACEWLTFLSGDLPWGIHCNTCDSGYLHCCSSKV